jgi:hypothetical protein
MNEMLRTKIGLLLVVAMLTARAANAQKTAMIMITSGESSQCQFGNMNVAWMVVVRKPNSTRASRKYVSSLDGCTMIPITEPIGSEIIISGMIEDRLSVQGLAPTVTQGCFNVEAYSVGLASENVGDLNPQDPNNIINDQGYGLFWDQTDIATDRAKVYRVNGCFDTLWNQA